MSTLEEASQSPVWLLKTTWSVRTIQVVECVWYVVSNFPLVSGTQAEPYRNELDPSRRGH